MSKTLIEIAENKMKLFPVNNNKKMTFLLESFDQPDATYLSGTFNLNEMEDIELISLIRLINWGLEIENEDEVLTCEEVIEKTCQVLNRDYAYYVSNSGPAIISEYIITKAEMGRSVEQIVNSVADELDLLPATKTS